MPNCFYFCFPPISTFMWFTVNENCLMLAVTLTRLRSLFSTRSTCSLFLFLFFIINLTVKLFYCLLSGWGVSPFLSCCICDFKSFIYTSLRFSEANSFETFYFVRVSIIFLDFFCFFCFCIYVCVCRRIASVVGVHLVVQGMLCWWAVSSVSDRADYSLELVHLFYFIFLFGAKTEPDPRSLQTPAAPSYWNISTLVRGLHLPGNKTM